MEKDLFHDLRSISSLARGWELAPPAVHPARVRGGRTHTSTPASANMVDEISHFCAQVSGNSAGIAMTTRRMPRWMVAAAHWLHGGRGTTYSV
jgi:hypothetical protein